MTRTQRESKGLLTDIKLELHTPVSGKEDSEMAMANKFGQMVLVMKVIGKTIEHRALENSHILMVIFTKATGSMIRRMEMEFIFM